MGGNAFVDERTLQRHVEADLLQHPKTRPSSSSVSQEFKSKATGAAVSLKLHTKTPSSNILPVQLSKSKKTFSGQLHWYY